MPSEQTMSDSEFADPADPVVVALLSYLRGHPQAADSLTGVVRWWVGEDGPFSVERVRQALDLLVERGNLRRERLADGTDWYAAHAPPPTPRQTLH